MSKTHFFIIFIIILVVIVLLVPAPTQDESSQVQTGKVAPKHIPEPVQALSCTTMTTGCATKVADMSVVLTFPSDVIYLNSFPVEVSLSGGDALLVEDVKIDFQMLKMDMGVNIYQLQQDTSNKTLWKGKAILPVCVTGRTDWQAYIELKVRDKMYKTAFQFEVKSSTQ